MMKLPKLLLTSCILMNAYASDTGRPAAVSGRHLQPHTRPATTIAETRPQATILPKTLPEALQALAESQEENQKLRLRIQELEALLAQTTLKQAPLQDAPPPAAAAAAKCTLHGLSPKELDVLTQAKTIEIGTPERTAAAQRLKEIFTTPKHQANLKQYLDAVDKNIDQHSPSEVKCAQVLAMQYIFMTTIAPLVYADHTMVFFNENQIKKNQPPFYTFLKEFMTDANKSFEELKKGYPKLFHFFANQAGFEGKNIEPCFIQNELITKAVEEENKTTKKMETVSSGELSLAETCTDKKPILLELLTAWHTSFFGADQTLPLELKDSPVFVSLLQPAGGRWKITESFPIVTGIKKPLLAIQWTEGYPSTDIPTKALGYAGHYPFFKYPQVRNTTFIQNNKTGIANLFLAYMFSNTTSDTPDTASSAAGMPSTQPAA